MNRSLRKSPENYAEGYNPGRLLDWLTTRFGLRTDTELSIRLGVSKIVISKVRNRALPLGASLLVSIHEESGVPTKELRRIMGDRRKDFRTGFQKRAGKPLLSGNVL